MSNTKTTIIETITAPLGFFVLALLIVESFLATVLVGANLESVDKVLGIWLGIGLFIIVITMVFILVWFKPESLTFDKSAHLMGKGLIRYGEKKTISEEDRENIITKGEKT